MTLMNFLITPPPNLQRYCLSIPPELAAECLTDWEWLLPLSGALRPVLITKLGDWFLADKESKLHFLSLLDGDLTPLDACHDEVMSEGFLERYEDCFLVHLVELLLEQGRELPEDMCYGWSVHPILGGSVDSSNIQFFSIRMCQWIHAQLHEQLQARAEGFDVVAD